MLNLLCAFFSRKLELRSNQGHFRSKKKPIKLAKRMGVKGLTLVSFVSKVVLTGVRVLPFKAAIVQIIARAGFNPGIKAAIALPIQAP